MNSAVEALAVSAWKDILEDRGRLEIMCFFLFRWFLSDVPLKRS